MSLAIKTPPANVAREVHDPNTKAAADDTAKVGREFEAILVRQMLSQVEVAGKSGYADMAVESLAASITSAGGLGLGRAIAQVLDRSTKTADVAPPEKVTPKT